MTTDSLSFRFIRSFAGAAAALALLFVAGGCGSSQETMENWEEAPAISPNARLEYRVDSLQNENRRMREQVSAMAAENRSLTAKNAELETKLIGFSAARQTTPYQEPAATPAPVETPTGYSSALSAFNKRDFTAAIRGFEKLLKGSVGDDLADNCHYWLGESYYGLQKYDEAVKHFNEVLGYKVSEKKADAQLMAGNSYLAMGDKDAARNAYDKVVSSYPSHVKKAQAKLAKMK